MDIEYSSRHVKVVGKYPPEVIRVPPSGLIAEEERACLFAKHGNYAEPRDIDNGTLRKDMPKRAALVVDITQKLENYGKCVFTPEFEVARLILDRHVGAELLAALRSEQSLALEHPEHQELVH